MAAQKDPVKQGRRSQSKEQKPPAKAQVRKNSSKQAVKASVQPAQPGAQEQNILEPVSQALHAAVERALHAPGRSENADPGSGGLQEQGSEAHTAQGEQGENTHGYTEQYTQTSVPEQPLESAEPALEQLSADVRREADLYPPQSENVPAESDEGFAPASAEAVEEQAVSAHMGVENGEAEKHAEEAAAAQQSGASAPDQAAWAAPSQDAGYDSRSALEDAARTDAAPPFGKRLFKPSPEKETMDEQESPPQNTADGGSGQVNRVRVASYQPRLYDPEYYFEAKPQQEQPAPEPHTPQPAAQVQPEPEEQRPTDAQAAPPEPELQDNGEGENPAKTVPASAGKSGLFQGFLICVVFAAVMLTGLLAFDCLQLNAVETLIAKWYGQG